MKAFFVLAVALFSLSPSIVVAAPSNPQIRQCNLVQGEFITIQTTDDQIGLCRIGAAYIGALDLFTFVTQQQHPISIEVYAKGLTACDPLGASITVQTLEGQDVRVCLYADGSVIELSTLHNGKYSNQNKKLNAALGL